jgi:integrase
MKGHVRQRGKGHWYAVVDVRDPVTRKRRRKWHSLPNCRGKREAEIECARLITEMSGGTNVDATKMTVAAYLVHWLAYKRTLVSPRSHENYGEVIHCHLIPQLGNLLVAKLEPDQIGGAYSRALESGRRDGGGLSPRSVRMMHRILSQAMKQAVRWRKITRNPCDAVAPPRLERKPMNVLDASGLVTMMEAARGRAIFMPIMLAMLCGLRRGEISALRWRDFDLEAPQASIGASIEQTNQGTRRKPPKSGRGRTVALPALAVEELRRHRIKQAEDLLRLGIRQTEDTHVCLQPSYQPWPPRNLSAAFVKFMVASKLPRIRGLHILRHSHATQMLAANIHPKVVQERLGHASITTTMDLYMHVMPGMQEDAASRVDAALREAIDKRKG